MTIAASNAAKCTMCFTKGRKFLRTSYVPHAAPAAMSGFFQHRAFPYMVQNPRRAVNVPVTGKADAADANVKDRK
jgi:hypothetical protein